MNTSKNVEPTILRKLEQIHQSGVSLYMDGRAATPSEIAEKCVKEEASYMPDYVIDDMGSLQEVRYDKVFHE